MVGSDKRRTSPRTGFTLVEMLVSTALIIFVMLILTTVFTAGLSALRNMRGVGSLQDQLRQAATVLRRDLAAPHFARETTGIMGPNLSQQRMDLFDWTPPKEGFFRVWQGAPSLPEGGWAAPGIPNSMDGDQIPSYAIDPAPGGTLNPRAGLHYLHFTVRNDVANGQGSGRDRFFATQSFKSLPVPIYNQIAPYSRPEYLASDFLFYSPWAEVAYFLQPSGQSADATTLYTLYRRRRVLVDIRPPNVLDANANPTVAFDATQAAALNDVSLAQLALPAGKFSLNTPSDIRNPVRRLGMNPAQTTQPAGVMLPVTTRTDVPYSPNSFYPLFDANMASANPEYAANQNRGGDDVLLENVVSFEVKASWDVPTDTRIDRRKTSTGAAGVTRPRPFAAVAANVDPDYPAGTVANPDYPFDDLPLPPQVFANTNLLGLAPSLTPSPPRVFDTWTNNDTYSTWSTGGTPQAIPLRIRMKAIQVRLRVWDAKTQQTRQITIIQDL